MESGSGCFKPKDSPGPVPPQLISGSLWIDSALPGTTGFPDSLHRRLGEALEDHALGARGGFKLLSAEEPTVQ